MTRIGDALRRYDCLSWTQGITQRQAHLYTLPNETWGEVLGKFGRTYCLHLGGLAATTADMAAYVGISTLRAVGLFCPLPPPPPIFPTPHTNAQFMEYAVKRAIWTLKDDAQLEMKESVIALDPDMFQKIGEWSIAFSYENWEKSSYYQPTFLTVSEPLEDGSSYKSVRKAFVQLKARDQNEILRALYQQTAPKYLSSSGKKVYQNMRALASLLHQGNQGYLNTLQEFAQKGERLWSS